MAHAEAAAPRAGDAAARAAPAAAPQAPVTLADMPGEAPAEAPAAAISERVREAARAAGEAARALAGDDAAPVGGGRRRWPRRATATPDNLKRMKGVGPKFEVVLHELGIYHFDQIAGWGPEEIAWIDANLEGFTGRVVREDWVGQATILAAGGETEHSQRVDRGEFDLRDRSGMLADKDRIFTNIYGMFDRSLAGARARGHWDGTAEIIARGRDKIVEEMKTSGLRGRGGARVPDRAQMVVHAEGVGRAAALSGGERRRIRARRPARTARSCGTIRTR